MYLFEASVSCVKYTYTKELALVYHSEANCIMYQIETTVSLYDLVMIMGLELLGFGIIYKNDTMYPFWNHTRSPKYGQLVRNTLKKIIKPYFSYLFCLNFS